jgi:hypothetical protein
VLVDEMSLAERFRISGQVASGFPAPLRITDDLLEGVRPILFKTKWY